MGLRCWGERLETADFASSLPRVSMPVVFENNTVLKAVRTWVGLHNVPDFSTMEFRVYSDLGGTGPGQVLATATKTWTRLQISTASHAAREIYFDFDSPPALKAGTRYWFALWLNAYTGNASTHVYWIKGFPDPVYDEGLTVNQIKVGVLPFKVGFIGGEF